MVFAPFVLGRGVLCLLYRKQPMHGIRPADSVLTGYIVMIGLTEAAHLGTIVLKRSFSDCVRMFVLMMGVCLIIMIGVMAWELRGQEKDKLFSYKQMERREMLLWFAFVLLLLVQITLVATGQHVYLRGDMTVETVNSFLEDNRIYQVNPMTGEPYTLGMPMRLKMLCLPSFYGILSALFHLSAQQVVWIAAPIMTLVYSCLAYSLLARVFFPDSREKQACFMILVGILYLAGDYMYGLDGFGVMHSGFRGVAIRAVVLLPYTLASVCRKHIKLTFLCILAEACIVWTLYGMGACLFVAAVLTAVRVLMRQMHGGKQI